MDQPITRHWREFSRMNGQVALASLISLQALLGTMFEEVEEGRQSDGELMRHIKCFADGRVHSSDLIQVATIHWMMQRRFPIFISVVLGVESAGAMRIGKTLKRYHFSHGVPTFSARVTRLADTQHWLDLVAPGHGYYLQLCRSTVWSPPSTGTATGSPSCTVPRG